MKKIFFIPLSAVLAIASSFLIFTPLYGKSQEVRVGLFDNKPMCYTEAGKPAGIFIVVLDHVARQEGWQLEYVKGSWGELRQKLSNGEIDILPSMAVSAERQKLYAFNELDVFTNWGEIYVSPDSKISTFFDLEGQRVAVMDKAIYTTGPEGIFKLNDIYGVKSELSFFPSYRKAMEAVHVGKADAAVVNRLTGALYGEELGLRKSGIVFSPVKIRFGLNKDNPLTTSFIAAIDKHLQVLREDRKSAYHQELANILQEQAKSFQIPTWVFYVLWVIVTLVVILTFFIILLRRQVALKTKAFQDSEGRFRDLAENCLDWVWEVDENAIYTYASPRIKDLLGYSPEEVVGKSPFDLMPSPEKEKVAEEFQEIKRNRQSFALLENVNQHKDGRLVTLESSGVPVIDADGKFRGYRGIDRDISERKTLEERLRQAQKMEAIGTLAGGIAHDFNNILTGIFGYAELAKLKMVGDGEVTKDLDQILQGARRAKDLVSQILTFSRQSKQEKKVVQLSVIVKEALKLLRPSIPSTIKIEQEISSSAMVCADITQIHQMIMNLCTNAYHAMEERGGVLTLSLVDKRLQDSTFVSGMKLKPGNYVVLVVCDTGKGISAANFEKIFEPYFTTKDKGRGTGLGLAVVHGIVESHHGALEVQSTFGQGTCFSIYLPVFGEPDQQMSFLDDTSELPKGRGERILVVDDEEEIQRVLSMILREAGYEVDLCGNGDEALQALVDQPDRYQLLLSDMTMPGMTGKELAKEVTKQFPQIPVVICTGYSSQLSAQEAKSIGVRAYLEKPLVMSELLMTIRQVLDKNQEPAD